MRSLRHILAVAAAVALLITLTTSSALGSSIKSIYAEKTCTTIATTSTCIVTTSTLKVLLGATWRYLDGRAGLGLPIGSPMLITTAYEGGRSGTANGVCHFIAPAGHCEYAGGTGSLRGFHANFAVLFIGPGPVLSLTGTYWFDRSNGDDDEDED